MPVKFVFYFFLLLLPGINVRAQSSSLFEASDIYLHLDKTVYSNNENIWFTGYSLNNGFDTADRHSLYVLLIDPVGKKLVLSDRFPLSDGVGKGNLFIPDSLEAGDYSLVAYTNAFLHGGGERPFIGNIVLGARQRTSWWTDTVIRIAYFPEGGSLVRGRVCRMDLQVTGDRVVERSYHGILFSGQDSVSEFETDKWGRGTVFFIPQQDGHYHVVLDSTNSKRQVAQDFPPVRSSGYSLQLVRLSGDGLRLGIHSSDSVSTCFLRVQRGALPLYSAKLVFRGEGVLADIDTRNFPPGKARICLLNKDSLVVAGRDVYFPGPGVSCSIRLDSLSYHTRSRVTGHVHIADPDGSAQKVVFSLAAVYTKQLDTMRFINISGRSFGMSGGNEAGPATGRFLLTDCWENFHLPQGPSGDEDDYGRVLRNGKQLEKPEQILLTGEGLAIVSTDSSGAFELPHGVLLARPGVKIGVSVAGTDPEKYAILLANRYDSVNRLLARFVRPVVFVARPDLSGRETSATPPAPGAKLLQTVTVKSPRKAVLKGAFRALDGEFQSTTCRDWVCEYNVLNCRCHLHGDVPVEGGLYLFQARRGGDYKTVVYHSCSVRKKEDPLVIKKVAAVHQGKEFYATDYREFNPPDPEIHTTVFWAPLNSPDERGDFDFSFYTNDLAGEFTLVLQGMTERGGVSAQAGFRVNP